MSSELETAAAMSAGALKGRPAPADDASAREICENCGAMLEGRYCAACGQLAENYHRPLWSLVAATLSDSFSLDGRIARTLPALVFRPGHVTRNYIDGKRARYVPPFRLFLLASLVFFLTLFSVGDELGWFQGMRFVRTDSGMALTLGDPDQADVADIPEILTPEGRIDRERLAELTGENSDGLSEGERAYASDLTGRLADVYDNQALFFAAIRTWAPRLSLLLVPVLIILLTLMFAWRRRTYVYHHVIAALHFQTVLYLLGTALMVLGLVTRSPGILGALLLLPVYLYLMLRRTYDSGRILAVLRTLILVFSLVVALGLLTFAVVIVGVMEV